MADVLDEPVAGGAIGREMAGLPWARHATLPWVVAGCACVKGLELASSTPASLWMPFLVVAAVATVLRTPLSFGALAVVVLAVQVTPAYSNHAVLLFWLAVALAVTGPGAVRGWLLRSQLSIMYGFAAMAKLWPDWLSGEVLASSTWVGALLPMWSLGVLAWTTVTVEVILAVFVWRPGRWTIALAVALHLSTVVLVESDPREVLHLALFGALSLGVWWSVQGSMKPFSPRGEHDHGPGSNPG